MSLRKVLLAVLIGTLALSQSLSLAQEKKANTPKAAAKNAKPAAISLGHLAPDECLFFYATNGWKTPPVGSENKTEKLWSEESVQEYFKQLLDKIHGVIESRSVQYSEDEQTVFMSLPALIRAALEHPAAIIVRELSIDLDNTVRNGALCLTQFHLAVVIDAESDADAVREVFDNLIGTAPEDGPRSLVKETIDGTTFYHPQSPAQFEGVNPWVGMHKSYLILAMGSGEAKYVLDQLNAAHREPPWLQSMLNEMKIERPSSVFRLNVAGLWDTFDPLLTVPMVNEALQASGLTGLKRISSVSGYDPEFSVTKSVIETDGPPQGLLALLPDKPLTAADLKGIPANASQAFILRFDLEILEEAILKIADCVEPAARNQYQALSAQGEQMLGFSVRDDVIRAFGDVWTLYFAGDDANENASADVVFAVNVRDQKKLSKVHDVLIQQFKQLVAQGLPFLPPNITVDDFKSKFGTGHQLQLNNSKVAWIIAKDQLIIGSSSQSIEKHLSRLDANESLGTNAEVVAALKRDPKTVLISYHDPVDELNTIYDVLEQYSPLAVMWLQQLGIDIDLPDLPPFEDLEKHLSPSVSTYSRTEQGWQSQWQGVVPSVVSAAPVLIGAGTLFFIGRTSSVDFASSNARSKNNLKQIGLAMHNHHDVFNRFPERATRDKEDKPLLSWRVKLLPYLDQAELYNEFHLDEPWDSEHNKKLIERMPAVYASPDSPELTQEFKTRYLVAVADGTLFDGDEGPRLQEVTDGTSNTIMALETLPEKAVIWTQPDDLEIDFDDPLEGLVDDSIPGFLALLADGSVRVISSDINLKTLIALLTRAGGEVIGDF